MARKKPTGSGTRKWSRPKYAPKRKVCAFCADKNAKINYLEPEKLKTYISDRAKIVPRRRTGTCAKHQRSLAVAIKRARHLALLPYVPAHMRKVGSAISVPIRNVAPPPPPPPPPAEEAPAAEAAAPEAPVTAEAETAAEEVKEEKTEETKAE